MKKLSLNDFNEESMIVEELCNVSGGSGTIWTCTKTHDWSTDKDSDSDN